MHMYNRYIPQPDGSYRRSRVPDPVKPKPEPPYREQEDLQACPVIPSAPCEKPQVCPRNRQRTTRPQPPRKDNPQSAGGFLKNLLPKDMDTADLLIIVLLLLMAGDCQEDQNTALLTLALYFFM